MSSHRDARHAAAELAIATDEALADANAELARLRGLLVAAEKYEWLPLSAAYEAITAEARKLAQAQETPK